jgi:DNA-binding response OmpR family regulator
MRAMASELILVVDDEPNIVELVKLYLEQEGFRVVEAADGPSALEAVQRHNPDLVVLDIMLPEMDGWEVCRRIRSGSQVPIIMLTARDAEVDRIVGLELGSDDYLVKPFSPRELVARVKAVLRRSRPGGPDEEDKPLAVEDLVIDPGRRKVTRGEEEIALTTKEFDLLYLLALNRGIVLTRERLLERVWGYTYAGDTRTVDVHMRHLREKLEPDPAHPRYLLTVWGVGYKFTG